MNETIEQAIRRLGAPREAWLSGGDTEDDHWRFGIAMSKCQDHSGSCASTGSCTFGGDCFHSALHKAREAAALIRSLSLRVEAEKRAREEVERELSEERLWSSRYCVEDYEVRNAIGERFCLVPPDGGDVKTWEAAAEMRKTLEAAETHSAALARALAEARDELLECKADYHRNPSSVIDKCNAVLAEARSLLAPKEDTDA